MVRETVESKSEVDSEAQQVIESLFSPTAKVPDLGEDSEASTAERRRRLQEVKRCLAILVLILLTMTIPILVVLFLTRYGPITDPSSNEAFSGFHGGPKSRGTMNIVFLCFSTLITSAYAVVHPNVFPDGRYEGRGRTSKSEEATQLGGSLAEFIILVVAGIICPESLLGIAVREHMLARDVQKFLEEKGHKVSLSLAFLVVMRGFKNGEFVLDAKSFKRLMVRRDSMPATEIQEIPWSELEKTIKMRSRSNLFALTVAIMQLIWMITQTSARWATSLPISPLEIVTCGHALCAIPVYLAWRAKPLHVREPIDLTPYQTPVPELSADIVEDEARATIAKGPHMAIHMHMHDHDHSPRPKGARRRCMDFLSPDDCK